MTYPFVILDYGHGGRDRASQRYLTEGKQYLHTDVKPALWIGEGIVNRQIAARLIRRLLADGIEVRDAVAGKAWTTAPCWHDLEQSNVPLSARVAYANAHKGGLLISLHSNAMGNASSGPSHRTNGATVYTSSGQTASDEVASTLIDALAEALTPHGRRVLRGDWSDGDADYEADFYVLTRTKGAAILVEGLFYTNLDDARFLLSDEGQEVLAEAYLRGLRPWLARGSKAAT